MIKNRQYQIDDSFEPIILNSSSSLSVVQLNQSKKHKRKNAVLEQGTNSIQFLENSPKNFLEEVFGDSQS